MRLLPLLIIFLVHSSVAAITENIYSSEGYLVAQCTEGYCQYLIYTGLSNAAIINSKENAYQKYLSGPNGKIAKLNNSEASFLVSDFHGSIPVMIQKETAEQYLLDAFGNELNDKKAIYTDKHPIEGTELRNFNARFYDAELGRFTITDPLENMNWYWYADNNPLSFVDLTGKGISIVEEYQEKQSYFLSNKNLLKAVIGAYSISKLSIEKDQEAAGWISKKELSWSIEKLAYGDSQSVYLSNEQFGEAISFHSHPEGEPFSPEDTAVYGSLQSRPTIIFNEFNRDDKNISFYLFDPKRINLQNSEGDQGLRYRVLNGLAEQITDQTALTEEKSRAYQRYIGLLKTMGVVKYVLDVSSMKISPSN